MMDRPNNKPEEEKEGGGLVNPNELLDPTRVVCENHGDHKGEQQCSHHFYVLFSADWLEILEILIYKQKV